MVEAILKPGKNFKNKRRKTKIRKIVYDLSFGITNKLCDLVLISAMFMEEFTVFGGNYPRAAARFRMRAMNYPGIDIKQWLDGVSNARRKKWFADDGTIAEEGKKRLKNLLPGIHPQKSWDGVWYLVNFDIPENMRRARDILRDRLKRLRFGMLQQSIWISPVNFLGAAWKEIKELGLDQYVLCSEAKNIGEEDSKALANRIWKLSELNKQYEKFVQKYEKGIRMDKLPSVFMEFMHIFQDDPQLPLELLPDSWLGETARTLIQEFYTQGKFNKEHKGILAAG